MTSLSEAAGWAPSKLRAEHSARVKPLLHEAGESVTCLCTCPRTCPVTPARCGRAWCCSRDCCARCGTRDAQKPRETRGRTGPALQQQTAGRPAGGSGEAADKEISPWEKKYGQVPSCDLGEHCAVRKGARIGRMCDCPQGAFCNFFLLKCL
ncbi:hypothetical protein WMY93_022265 [Mugilogobius chulae]|uniref:Cocaine- and amphetamine-regulated transcript protein n=1 Tax=Mugilogobius chulae TaxID=88201 RepID=A0AAW0N7M7_9GOBI